MDYKRRILKRVDSQVGAKMGKFTLYLSEDLYAYFKSKCGDRAASNIVEEMMREFCGLKPGESPPRFKKP